MGHPHSGSAEWHCGCDFSHESLFAGSRCMTSQYCHLSSIGSIVSGAEAGLVIPNLDSVVQDLFSAGLVTAPRGREPNHRVQ